MRPFILVVDDDPKVGPLLCEYLESQGYRVTYCMDAAQALIQAESMRVGLIITDIMMPTYGTGIDVYRKIRAHPHFPKNVPIIFLTGLKPQQAQSMVPKNDPHVRLLHKPTTLANLTKTIHELTQGRLKGGSQHQTLPPSAPPPPTNPPPPAK